MTTTAPRPTEADAFAELVYDDAELVRAEFDALIAACWESPSGPPPRRSVRSPLSERS